MNDTSFYRKAATGTQHTRCGRWNRLYPVLTIAVLLLLNCKALQELATVQKPTVKVQKVRFTGLNFNAVDLTFDLQIDNPNQISASLAGLDYNFKVNNNNFLTGRQNRSLTINAGGSSTIELPISLNFTEIYNTFSGIKNQDSTAYKLDCGLTFDLPVLGETRIPVSKSGFVPLLKLPSISVASLKLNNMGLTGADLELQLGVDNPNGFSLSLQELNYNFQVNGSTWANGTTTETLQVGKNGRSTLAIPISLNLLQMGQSVARLLSENQNVDYSLNGGLDFRTSLPLVGEVNLPLNNTGTVRIRQ